MNRQRDIEQILDHWFSDGPTRAPDRVLDVVVDRLERQGQRPAWRLDRRRSPMNINVKMVLAIAAVMVVAVIGYNMLPGQTRGVGGPPATASPTASPTVAPSSSIPAAPSPSAAPTPSEGGRFPAWYTAQSDGAGILPAGSQTTRRFQAGSVFTVPEGWVNESDSAVIYALFPDTPANEAEYALSKGTAENIILTDKVANNMFAICDATGLFRGATAAEVINGLVANDKLSTTEPVDVTIGGLRGRQIDVQLSPDWSGGCPHGPEDPSTRDYKDARNRIIMLDTPDGGVIGIAIGSLYSSQFEAFLAEAMPILESFRFGLSPQASPSPS